jgi:hypothetical protein
MESRNAKNGIIIAIFVYVQYYAFRARINESREKLEEMTIFRLISVQKRQNGIK